MATTRKTTVKRAAAGKTVRASSTRSKEKTAGPGTAARSKAKTPSPYGGTRGEKAPSASAASRTKERTSIASDAVRPAAIGATVEDAWRGVDRLARAIWIAHHAGMEPPQSLADLITALRDEQIVPANEANMMHAIRSLRNLVVHESLEAGEHEATVARAAWEVVKRWAIKEESAAAKTAGLR